MGYLPCHTQVPIIYTHTQTQIILHISTYYTCQHKSMPHLFDVSLSISVSTPLGSPQSAPEGLSPWLDVALTWLVNT